MQQSAQLGWHLARAILALLLLGYATTVGAQQLPRTSGSITAAGSDCSVSTRCVSLNASGQAADTAAILVSGTWSATPIVEIAIEPSGTWTSQPETFNLATGAASATISGNGYYVVPLRGAQAVRVRASAFTSGSVVVAIGAAPATSGVAITQPLPAGSATIGAVTVSGVATAANQVTGNASLSSIDGKTPALGQALAAASVPIVLTAAQLSTLTPLAFPTAATAAAVAVRCVNTAGNAFESCAGSGGGGSGLTDAELRAAPVEVDITNASVAITAAALPLPSGAATSAAQTTGNNSLASIDGKITAVNTGAVVISSSALPSGASTSANQTTANASLSSIDGKTPALGQALAAASVPIVLTAAQLSTLTPLATIAATQSGAWNITNVSGTVSLPTGASTLAEQQTQTTALQTIDNIVSGSGVNVSQINGVAPSMDNGASGTGVQRVTLANNSTGILASVTQNPDVRQATAANLNAQVVGNVAHDSADSGNPVKIGAKALVDSGAGSTPTYVSTGERTDIWAERDGALVVSNREMPRKDAVWNASTPTALESAGLGTNDGSAGTLAIDTTRAGCGVIWIRPTAGSTFTAGSIIFEMSINGGTSWEALSGTNGDTTYTTSPLFPATDFTNGAEAGWRFPVQTFDYLRVRLVTAITGTGGPTFAISLRATAAACAPFTIARQSDPTRLHMTAHGYIANDEPENPADFPLKMGGTTYQGNSEAITALSNLPNVSASADRGTVLLTPYNEQRVVTSDKLKIGVISTDGGTAPVLGTPTNEACSPSTGCVVVPLEGMGSLIVDIPTVAWNATLHFESSIDGVWWSVTPGIETRNFTYAAAFGTSCAGTCGGTWQFILQQGFRYFRVRSSAYASGTLQIVVSATAQTGIFGLSFVEGDIAHGGSDVSTRPLKIGGKATTSISGITSVGDATRVNAAFDTSGRQITMTGCNVEDIVRGIDTDTAGDSTAVTNFGATASVRYLIYTVTVMNSSSTFNSIDIRDGTGGTVLWTIPAPGTSGATITFPVPIPLTANTALAIDPASAATTTTTSIIGCKSR